MRQVGHDLVPVGPLRVYLFTLEQSRPLQALQRKARERRSQLGAVGPEMGQMMAAYLGSAAELVPRLTRTAVARTQQRGSYRFEHVPSGKQYQVVALAWREDGLIFIQAVTPLLRPGEALLLDLNDTDDNDWTNVTPAPR
jgi:integrase